MPVAIEQDVAILSGISMGDIPLPWSDFSYMNITTVGAAIRRNLHLVQEY